MPKSLRTIGPVLNSLLPSAASPLRKHVDIVVAASLLIGTILVSATLLLTGDPSASTSQGFHLSEQSGNPVGTKQAHASSSSSGSPTGAFTSSRKSSQLHLTSSLVDDPGAETSSQPSPKATGRGEVIRLASLAPGMIHQHQAPESNSLPEEGAGGREARITDHAFTEVQIADQILDERTAAISPQPSGPFLTARSANIGLTSLQDSIQTKIILPPPDPLIAALEEGEWITETVGKHDTLTHVMKRLGFGMRETLAVVDIEEASILNRLHPGQKIHITKLPPMAGGKKSRLEKLKYRIDEFNTLLVRSQNDGYIADIITRKAEIRLQTAHASIGSSLLKAAGTAGIPIDVVYSLAEILAWQIDFSRDIKSGDHFTVIYEELYLDDKLVGHGQLIAAELSNRGRNIQVIRHVNEDGKITYYTPEGIGIESSFLRSPLKFARVTSKFSARRLHPVLNTWRAHNGVDYGAPMNTPIHTTGDGVVDFVGTKKGYGKTVIIRHGDNYKTLYAHMNRYRKGLRKGKRVNQGDVIGYVGRTGLATGPHLHYEFRIKGRHMDPLTVDLPTSDPIDSRYLEEFTKEAAHWVSVLDHESRTRLASLEP